MQIMSEGRITGSNLVSGFMELKNSNYSHPCLRADSDVPLGSPYIHLHASKNAHNFSHILAEIQLALPLAEA